MTKHLGNTVGKSASSDYFPNITSILKRALGTYQVQQVISDKLDTSLNKVNIQLSGKMYFNTDYEEKEHCD